MANPAASEFEHETWSSRKAFLLAAIGSAVGLGNIWRFPYITGINGGGAFVIVYCLCILVIAIPLLMAELAIGRRLFGLLALFSFDILAVLRRSTIYRCSRARAFSIFSILSPQTS